MSHRVPPPKCPNCDGLGQLDKYHREWVCSKCKGTGTLNQDYIDKVERSRAVEGESE